MSIKLPVDLAGEWHREGRKRRKRKMEEIVTTERWLVPMLQEEQWHLEQIMKRSSTSHTPGLHQQLRDFFFLKTFIIYSLPGAFPVLQKKKKLNNFEYISRWKFSANQKWNSNCFPSKYNTGVLHHFSTSAAARLIQYETVGPWRPKKKKKRLCISMQRLVPPLPSGLGYYTGL